MPRTEEDSSAIQDDDEAEINALLAAEGLQEPVAAPAPASKYADSIANATLCVRRDCVVLDAALGGRDAWDTALARSDVDYAEERPNADGGAPPPGAGGDGAGGGAAADNKCGLWAAGVSVVFSLYSLHAGRAPEHMHDETGSGQSEAQPSRAAAVEVAEAKAIEGARRRLAKRFANNLDNQLLAVLEADVGKGMVAKIAAPLPKKRRLAQHGSGGGGR